MLHYIEEKELKKFVKRGDMLKQHALTLDGICKKTILSYSSKLTKLVRLDIKEKCLSDEAMKLITDAVNELDSLKDELQKVRKDIIHSLTEEANK